MQSRHDVPTEFRIEKQLMNVLLDHLDGLTNKDLQLLAAFIEYEQRERDPEYQRSMESKL